MLSSLCFAYTIILYTSCTTYAHNALAVKNDRYSLHNIVMIIWSPSMRVIQHLCFPIHFRSITNSRTSPTQAYSIGKTSCSSTSSSIQMIQVVIKAKSGTDSTVGVFFWPVFHVMKTPNYTTSTSSHAQIVFQCLKCQY